MKPVIFPYWITHEESAELSQYQEYCGQISGSLLLEQDWVEQTA